MSVPSDSTTSASPTATTQPGDSLIGRVLAGRYRLLERIGTGGMGAVYRGEHIALRKRVAIKFLHAELSRIPEVVARFEREAVAAAHLEHPNVVAAIDYGQSDDGLFFLVMEFVDGGSLRDLLNAEKHIPPPRVLHIAWHIATALNRAHSLGIVHRDLKPENVVMVNRDGDRDFAKVIDFGIAKVTAENLQSGAALTQAGMVFGTPDYMAPEQALGGKIDHRADLYAFGVMVFEMLAGTRPFQADDVMTLLSRHLTSPPPAVTLLAPPGTLPPQLDPVLFKIMAKSPGDRYGSALEFMQGLNAAFGSVGPPLTLGTTPPVGVPLPPPSATTGSFQAPTALIAPTGTHPQVPAPADGLSGQGQVMATATAGKNTLEHRIQRTVTAILSSRYATATMQRLRPLSAFLSGQYATLQHNPRRLRQVSVGATGLAILILGFAVILALRPRPHREIPTITPQTALRPTRSPANGATTTGHSATSGVHLQRANPSPTNESVTLAGQRPVGLPPSLAADLAAYQAQPNVAMLLAQAHGRHLWAVITAFEQTRARAPNDAVINYLLGTLYARDRGRTALAIVPYANAVRIAPGFAQDPTLVHDVAAIYVSSRRPLPQAEALLQGPLVTSALPQLLDLALDTRPSVSRTRAIAVVSQAPFVGRLDATTRTLLDLSKARTCTEKLTVVTQLGSLGDPRALPYLRRIPTGNGCGFFGLERCNPCLTQVLPEAISAIEQRQR